jgi:branched-chain amino acid transport system permease protein
MSWASLPRVILLAAAMLLPILLEGSRYASYVEHVAVQMMLLGIFAMSWDLIFGYLGLFSFGHAAFFGVGGYVAGMLVAHAGMQSGALVLLIALLASGATGLAVGFVSARVGSVAVFLVTFACAEAIYLIVIANPLGLTNGDNGLLGVVPRSLAGIDLAHQLSFYYLALAALLASYTALRRITTSQFGLVLLGIRDNETRVAFAGYYVAQYKAAAFAIAGVFAGLAGALTAFHERIASPEMLAWSGSGDVVLYSTLGGTGTLLGPVLGAGIVILVRELLSDYLQSWLIFVGITYVALIFFLPGGLYSLLSRRGDAPTAMPGRFRAMLTRARS